MAMLLDEITRERLDAVFSAYSGNGSELIPVLQRIQQEFGYLPGEAMKYAADFLGVPESTVFGVASFYSQFRFTPAGRYTVKVCHGTACHVANASEITEKLEERLRIKDGETTSDGMFTLESVACVGCCSLAPLIMIGDEVYGKLNPAKAARVVSRYSDKTKDKQGQ